MTADSGSVVRAIVELKQKRPFEPFRIVTSKGAKLLVPDADMVVNVGDYMHVLMRSGELVRVPKSEIVAIEELKVICRA